MVIGLGLDGAMKKATKSGALLVVWDLKPDMVRGPSLMFQAFQHRTMPFSAHLVFGPSRRCVKAVALQSTSGQPSHNRFP